MFVLLIYMIIVWNITSIFTSNITIKIYMTIITSIPIIALFYTYLSEDIVYEVIYMIIRYILSIKLYVYMLDYPSEKVKKRCKRKHKMI